DKVRQSLIQRLFKHACTASVDVHAIAIDERRTTYLHELTLAAVHQMVRCDFPSAGASNYCPLVPNGAPRWCSGLDGISGDGSGTAHKCPLRTQHCARTQIGL